jgi:hypothetical protein
MAAIVLPVASPETSWMRIAQPKLFTLPENVPVMVGLVPTSPAGVSIANSPRYPVVPLTIPPRNVREFVPSEQVHTVLSPTPPAFEELRETSAMTLVPELRFAVHRWVPAGPAVALPDAPELLAD